MYKLSSIIILVLLVLTSLLLLNIYDRPYNTTASVEPIRSLSREHGCQAEDISEGFFSPTSSPVESTRSPTEEKPIPRQEWYDELKESGAAKMEDGNPKMNIFLMAAYEYPYQINVMMTSSGKYGDVVYCRYFDKLRSEIGVAFKSVVLPQFNVHCALRTGTAFMSLTDAPTGDYDYPVPIIDRTHSEPKYFFSVCLAPLYGKEPKWLQLAELFEHYKLQGASYFYVYIKDNDEYSRLLLDDYIRTGEAEAIVLRDHYQRANNRWHSVHLQDCLLRARHHSRWITFVDLDERLIMTEYNGTIKNYLKNITNPKIGGIQFRQQWVLKNESQPVRYEDDEQVGKWMPTMRYHNTSHVGPVGHTAKCIVDPEKVLVMSVHHVHQFFDDYILHRLNPEEGVVRQYRDVNSGEWGRLWLPMVEEMGNFSMTDYPMLYNDLLLKNVQVRTRFVYGTSAHNITQE